MRRRAAAAALTIGAASLAIILLLRRRAGSSARRSTADGVEAHPFDPLDGHDYVRLTTFRRTGEPVDTPVWFARSGDNLYVTTDPRSGKMKRIRNDQRVLLTPCTPWNTPRGRSVEAVGRPFDDDGRGERALAQKYGWKMRLFRRWEGEDFVGRATLELRPPPT